MVLRLLTTTLLAIALLGGSAAARLIVGPCCVEAPAAKPADTCCKTELATPEDVPGHDDRPCEPGNCDCHDLCCTVAKPMLPARAPIASALFENASDRLPPRLIFGTPREVALDLLRPPRA